MPELQPTSLARPYPRQIPGLDGLRALAVVAVMLFHAELDRLLPGGFLGVDVFFTLSGFLITTLILNELSQTGRLQLGRFYLRRFRRLVPALGAVLVASAVYAVDCAPDAIAALRQDFVPSLLYVSNFWQLLSAQPYFEKFGRPHVLQHLWSLAIEEQFYTLWPLVVAVAFRIAGRRLVFAVSATLTVATAAWAWHLANRLGIPYDAQPERLYFGTDTHTVGIFAGTLLAAAWPGRAGCGGQRWHRCAGWAALAGLLVAFAQLDESSYWLYRLGFPALAVATCVLVTNVAWPGTLLNRLFEWAPLKWIGRRSYGLYLWHWPVFAYLRPGEVLPGEPYLAFVIRLLVTFGLAELSFRALEHPLRERGLQAWGRMTAPLLLGLASFSGWAVFQLFNVQVPPPAPVVPTPPAAVVEAEAAQPAAPGGAVASSGSRYNRPYPLELTTVRVAAIGDSVLLGTGAYLNRRLPIVKFDAVVGRQGSEALKVIQTLKTQQALPAEVLLHLGTNGYLYEQHLQQIFALLEDRRRVVLFNVHANRRWTAGNNQLLRKYAARYPNVRLVDWDATAADHPEYFVADGIHLTGKGIVAFVELAAAAFDVPRPPPTSPTPPSAAKPKRASKPDSDAIPQPSPPASDSASAPAANQ